MAHGYGHIVSIEKMTPDLLGTTKINVTGFFPDDFVESPSLFKRKSWYYLTYGSCCCGCQEGKVTSNLRSLVMTRFSLTEDL